MNIFTHLIKIMNKKTYHNNNTLHEDIHFDRNGSMTSYRQYSDNGYLKKEISYSNGSIMSWEEREGNITTQISFSGGMAYRRMICGKVVDEPVDFTLSIEGLNIWKVKGDVKVRLHEDFSNIKMVESFHSNGKVCTRIWMKGDLIHNDNGPAMESYLDDGRPKSFKYICNGKLHNMDGPAVIKLEYTEYEVIKKEMFFIEGKLVRPIYGN